MNEKNLVRKNAGVDGCWRIETWEGLRCDIDEVVCRDRRRKERASDAEVSFTRRQAPKGTSKQTLCSIPSYNIH